MKLHKVFLLIGFVGILGAVVIGGLSPTPASWVVASESAVGTNRNYSVVTGILARVGSRPINLIFDEGDWLLTNNVAFPTNVTVTVVEGARFVIPTNVALAFNGGWQAGHYAVFEGEGTASGTAQFLWNVSEWGDPTQYQPGTGDINFAINGLSNWVVGFVTNTAANVSNGIIPYVDNSISNITNWVVTYTGDLLTNTLLTATNDATFGNLSYTGFPAYVFEMSIPAASSYRLAAEDVLYQMTNWAAGVDSVTSRDMGVGVLTNGLFRPKKLGLWQVNLTAGFKVPNPTLTTLIESFLFDNGGGTVVAILDSQSVNAFSDNDKFITGSFFVNVTAGNSNKVYAVRNRYNLSSGSSAITNRFATMQWVYRGDPTLAP